MKEYVRPTVDQWNFMHLFFADAEIASFDKLIFIEYNMTTEYWYDSALHFYIWSRLCRCSNCSTKFDPRETME